MLRVCAETRLFLCGVEDRVGGPDSATRPACITWTVCDTLRAKPIACVTTIIVWPLLARSVMTLITSAAIRGSRALVGSSNRIASGFIASARAMATRCCWPPESWSGMAASFSARPTRAKSCAGFGLAFVARAVEHVQRAGQHVFQHAHVREQVELLEDHAHAAAERRGACSAHVAMRRRGGDGPRRPAPRRPQTFRGR